MFKVGVAICLLGLLINSVQNLEFRKLNTSTIDCPNQWSPGEMVVNEQVKALNLRLPETGLYEYPISCVMILDNLRGPNVANITDGGRGFKFIEVQFLTWMADHVDYNVRLYIKSPNATLTTGESII